MTRVSSSFAAAGALSCALPFIVASPYLQHLLVLWLLYATLALSLNIIIGELGELSFGHAAFFGIGAYASALLAMRLGVPTWLGPICAAAIAGVAGWMIGYLALRSTGPHFAILTLAFGSIVYTITNYWVDLTRGPMGISNVPPFVLPGLGIDFGEARHMYYVALGVLALTVYGCHALKRSVRGRAFVAVRENAQLAASIGVDVFRTKLAGFTAAAALAGLVGALYGQYLKVITAEMMGLHNIVALIIMVIVGGKGTIVGPVIGALVYVCLLEFLRAAGSLRLVVFALLLILCVIFLPGGLVSLVRRHPGTTASRIPAGEGP